MIVELNRSTGEFTVRVGQADILRAPDYEGQPTKWLPCTRCCELHAVALHVVSFFCRDECKAGFEEANPSRQSEIPGFSHACGYHD